MEINFLTHIQDDYADEYQQWHKAICINLLNMIWNISFLKKAKEASDKGINNRNDFIIRHIYINEFELLVLRYNRTFLDQGEDAITLSKFKNNCYRKYLVPEYKADLKKKLKDISWSSVHLNALRHKVDSEISILRNNCIAHTLANNEEASVTYNDIEEVLNSACELFEALSFDTDRFYLGREKFYLNLHEEISSTDEFMTEFFLFQELSAYCVETIKCDINNEPNSEEVKKDIEKLNAILSKL